MGRPPRSALANRRFRTILLLAGGPPVLGQTFLISLQDTMNGSAGGAWRDFWLYLKAAAAIRSGANPYAYFFGSPDADPTRAGRYIYPPLWAWLLQPLSQVSRAEAGLILFLVSELCFLGFVVVCARALRADWQLAFLVYVLGGASFWFFDLLHEGQVEAVLLLLTAIWLLAWVEDDRAWGGVALGVATMIKLLQAPLLLLVLARRRWRMALGAAAALVVTAALTAPNQEWTFFTSVLPSLGGGTPYVENQSPAGTAYRALGAGGTAHAVSLGLAAVLAAATAWAVGLGERDDRDGRALEAAAVAALVPLVTPVTWAHHLFADMLPIFVVLHVGIRRQAWLAVAAVGAAWLLANPLHIEAMVLERSSAAVTAGVAVLAESGVLAALLIWASSIWLIRTPPMRLLAPKVPIEVT